MSFIAPIWLAVAGMVAAGVVIAHLFSTNVPPREVLPTVRFVPQGAPLAVLRTRRLTDVLLLLLRVLAVLLLGLALAGAHTPRTGPSRVLLIDVSRSRSADAEPPRLTIASSDEARTPVRERTAATESFRSILTIVVDSQPRSVAFGAADTLGPTGARGSLSAGIVAAHRAIANVTAARDDIELVIVSPFARESVDSATAPLLALWEGPVRLVRMRGAEPPEPWSVEIRAHGDDPVAAALSGVPRPGAPLGVRIVRDTPTAADSAWVRESSRVLVMWPAASVASAVLDARPATDTVDGFSMAGSTVIGNFARSHQPSDGRAIGRWVDGAPAATESALGEGCVRVVAIPVDPVGDVALRESVRGVVQSLLEPCGGARDFTPVPDSALLALRGGGGEVQIPREVYPEQVQIPRLARNDRRGARNDRGLARHDIGLARNDGRLPLILAAIALAALLVEQLMRRRARTA